MIRRGPRESHFVIVPNDTIRDGRLSFKARGLLAYILSMPDEWEVTSRQLSDASTDGVDGVLTGLKELERHGYLVRERVQDEKGRWGWDQVVFDVPQDQPKRDLPCSDQPKRDLPYTDNPVSEAGRTEALEEQKETLPPTTKTNGKCTPYEAEFAALWDLYPKKQRRKDAYKRYVATVRRYKPKVSESVIHERLLRCTRHFATAMASRQQEHIMYGERFLGPNEPWRDFDEAPNPYQDVDPTWLIGQLPSGTFQ